MSDDSKRDNPPTTDNGVGVGGWRGRLSGLHLKVTTVFLLFGAFTAAHQFATAEKVQAQTPVNCLPGVPGDCVPSVPSLGDALDATINPVIASISDAANQLIDGLFAKLAADMAAAAVGMLDLLWTSVQMVIDQPLDSVQFPHQQALPLGLGLATVATMAMLGRAGLSGSPQELGSAMVRPAVAVAGITLTRPIIEVFDGIAEAALEMFVRNSNAQVGIWIEQVAPGLIGPDSLALWPLVFLFSLLFIISVIAVIGSLMFMEAGLLLLYAAAPLLWPAIIHPKTRHWFDGAVASLVTVTLGKIAIGLSISVSTSVLTFSGHLGANGDPAGALTSLLFGTMLLMFAAFTPKALWSMTRLPYNGDDSSAARARAVGTAAAGAAMAKKAAGAAAVAATGGAAAAGAAAGASSGGAAAAGAASKASAAVPALVAQSSRVTPR